MNPTYEHHRPYDGCDLYRGDALDVLPLLAEEGITADMVLSDPPYDTTHCRWDAVIDTPGMWNAVQGISKPDTLILQFCQHPFTSLLGSSNLRRLRYAWVWEKTQATGFLNARRMPMKAHEDILVFYDRLPKYHPIKTDGHKRKVVMAEHQRKCDAGEIYRKHDNFRDYISTERYPRSVLKIKTDKQLSCLHATQKPVALLEYLIRTYTDEEYKISNLGRVKSLERQVSHDGITWTQPERIMCHWCGTTSLYDCVRLYKGGVGKKFSVHRLVAQHFLPGWNPGLEVNHIDGNRDNNRADDLEMCTHQRNMEHAIAGGLKQDYGEKSVNAKLTNGQAEEIRVRYSSGQTSQNSLAKQYGVSRQTVSAIIRYKKYIR